MIGVSIQGSPISAAQAEAMGLKDRKGAVVSTVAPSGPAAKAGLEPGDVVTEFNGRPVNNDRALVEMVVATKPGTTVPVKVIRDGAAKSLNVTVAELDLEGESGDDETEAGETDVAQGFGIVLEDITPAIARRLKLPSGVTGALVSEVRPRSVAARQGITEGDVIVRLGRSEVTSADDAMRELQRVQVGQAIGVRLYRSGQEMFFTMRKE
jgi:serine protease Do